MKYLLLLFLFLSFSIGAFAQPDYMRRIMDKQNADSGQLSIYKSQLSSDAWFGINLTSANYEAISD